MFVFVNLITAIATILNLLLNIYKWIIIIAALISWVHPDPYNPIVRFLYSVTDPVLRPIRRLIGHSLGPIDISPLIVIIVIIFVQNFLIKTLMKIGLQFGGG